MGNRNGMKGGWGGRRGREGKGFEGVGQGSELKCCKRKRGGCIGRDGRVRT